MRLVCRDLGSFWGKSLMGIIHDPSNQDFLSEKKEMVRFVFLLGV